MQTALLLISFRNNFFKKGSQRVKGAKQSAKAAAKLLAHFRENELPIVHVLQTGKLEDLSAEKLKPYELLEPKQDEPILVISETNAFADPKLQQKLQSLEVDHLLIAGLTAEKQILATVLAAKELAYTTTVVQDACAANSLKIDGERIKAEVVRQVIMASLRNADIEITTTKTFVKAELKKKKKQLKQAAKHEVQLEMAAPAPVLKPATKKKAVKVTQQPAATENGQSKARNKAATVKPIAAAAAASNTAE